MRVKSLVLDSIEYVLALLILRGRRPINVAPPLVSWGDLTRCPIAIAMFTGMGGRSVITSGPERRLGLMRGLCAIGCATVAVVVQSVFHFVEMIPDSRIWNLESRSRS